MSEKVYDPFMSYINEIKENVNLSIVCTKTI